MKITKKWYSFAESAIYEGEEPNFFDIENKSWKKLLEKNFGIILKEFQQIVEKGNKNLIPYFNKTLASDPNSWTVFPLLSWKEKHKENCDECPETIKIIEKIEGLTSCLFSILKPHTKIKPHFGDSNVMYRCHLTLKCDGKLPEIGMRVGEKSVSWENGKLIAFCDAYNHEVWNNTDSERWILIVDILREEFLPQQKQICKEVRSTLWWQLKFQNFYFIKHLPKWSRKILMKITTLFM